MCYYIMMMIKPTSTHSCRNILIGTVLILALAFSLTLTPFGPGDSRVAYGASEHEKDVASWSDKELAAQLLMFMTGTKTASLVAPLTEKGAGGIALQTPIPADLASRITEANKKAPNHIKPFIASDEEGGLVQRFRSRIYAIPSAQKMNAYADKKITSITRKYAKRLSKYKVNVVFGPVADLKVQGKYLTRQERTFATTPNKVWKKTNAWSKGFEKEGVIVTYKHWPGEGNSADTHTKSSKVPKLSVLEQNDMIPFNKKFKQGCEMVMIGHVIVPGLTEKNTPTSLSKKAYKYLRKKSGDDTVIITDSLTMDAATTAVGLTVQQAAVKSLKSGADVALVTSSSSANDDKIIKAVANAIKSGKLPRKQAEASAERSIRLKEKHGLA